MNGDTKMNPSIAAINVLTRVINDKKKYNDYLILFFGSFFSFCAAVIISYGNVPNIINFLSAPLIYGGDGLFSLWYIERISDAWVIESMRSGYPFGSDISNYPNSDMGSFIILKILSLFLSESSKILKVYYFFGFVTCFISSFIVLRLFKINRLISFFGAIVFTFAPFHFDRIGHIFLTFYFVVPLYFYIAFKCFSTNLKTQGNNYYFKYALFSIFLASFGVYYAFFGCFIILLSALAKAFRDRTVTSLYRPLFYIGCICFGVLINISPLLYNKLISNEATGFNRGASEAEVYGLKIHQLLAPRVGHRISRLSEYTSDYNTTNPLTNENTSSSLGAFGSIGFILILTNAFMILVGVKTNNNMLVRFCTFLLIPILLFATIGGFSSVFSHLVTGSIRAWNRISIFISFISIAFLCVFLQHYYIKIKKRSILICSNITLILLTAVAVLDQTPKTHLNHQETHSSYQKDKLFISNIEKTVKKGGAIYQLPYMAFPESAPIHKLGDYWLSIGFLHSNELKWSYAGLRGSVGDLFFKALSSEPIVKQVEVIKNLGFSGVYIDLRGYADAGVEIQNQLEPLLGKPTITHEDRNIIFYPVKGENLEFIGNESTTNIMKIADFIADENGKRYDAEITDILFFNKRELPAYILNVKGLSGVEDWGRWSDSSQVIFKLNQSLPENFSIDFSGITFGPNAGKEIIVTVGEQSKSILLSSSDYKYHFGFNNIENNIDTIVFSIPKPISPKELGDGTDNRKLGFGFKTMNINM